jgi:hypothetical protein
VKRLKKLMLPVRQPIKKSYRLGGWFFTVIFHRDKNIAVSGW